MEKALDAPTCHYVRINFLHCEAIRGRFFYLHPNSHRLFENLVKILTSLGATHRSQHIGIPGQISLPHLGHCKVGSWGGQVGVLLSSTPTCRQKAGEKGWSVAPRDSPHFLSHQKP